MSKKILALDIDGTLTTSKKEISPKTREALLEMQNAGHLLVLASGRPTPGMMRYAKELALAEYGGYLLSFNGARITACKTGEVLYQQTLPPSVIPDLYQFAVQNHCGIITYYKDSVVSGTAIDPYISLESRINGMPVMEIKDFPGFVNYAVNKCLMTAEPEQAELYVAQLQEQYANTLSIYRSEPFFIEIMPRNVDKANSLAHMLQILGMQKSDLICCGDGYNDITMISYAGTGVAMANARAEVKAAADYVTGSNDEDGLVSVIETFILS